MNDYRILNSNADKGVTIVVNATNGKYAALVNGKYYSVSSYRPLDGNGRQLRGESIAAIDELMTTAPAKYEKLIESRNAEIAALAEKMSEKPRKTFADVLEESFIATLTEKSASEMVDSIYPTVEKMMIERFGIIPKVHEIRIPDRPTKEVKGVLHKDFDKIVSMISDGESVYLCGAAGGHSVMVSH